MPARIHQDYGRYLLRRGDLRETRREKERERGERRKQKTKKRKMRRRKKEGDLSCPFSCTMKVDVLFSSLAGLLYGDRLRAANGTETRSNATAW